MTSVDHVTRILPGSPEWAQLLTQIGAGAKDRDLNDENPFDQVAALTRAGFGTLRLPEHLGGAGFTVPQLFSSIIDVAHADPIVAHIFRTHFWFVEERLRTSDDPSSAHWLRKVAEGNIFGNAFSEKGPLAVGSLVFNTRLLPDPNSAGRGYRLDGEKFYSTGTLFSDYLTVATTTDHDSVATVVVPADRDGVRLIDDWDGFGQRRTGTGTSEFTNVAVWEDEVLSDAPYDADPVPTVQYASLQLFIHAVVAGILASVVDDGIALLRSRDRSFSHALSEKPTDDPLYQRQLGELASTAYIARAAVLDAAEAIDAATASETDGVPDAQLAAEAQLKVAKVKVHLDDVAPEAATRLLELGGASAASRQRNLDRHWRNIRTITLHNPVAYKARVIGQNLLHGTPVRPTLTSDPIHAVCEKELIPVTRQLHLGGFQIASQVTHSHAAWRHPGSDTRFTTPDYYHRIGRILERGKFDFLFFADLLAAPVRFGDDITEPLRRGTQATATLDPSIVAASIGAVTSKLGIAITKSATYFHPYELARIFSSLDHITQGRVAWNIVTSLTQSEAQNFGHDNHLDHEFRYERADEFVRTTLELWSSWDPDALVLDKASGVFADPSRIRPVDHDGPYFRSRGPLNVPHPPQGRPVLIQAGSSNTGKDFAARWAEAIFEIDPTPEGRRNYYDDIKFRAVNFGRDPDQVLIFPAFIPFIGETESIAREKQAFHNELADPISGLITLSVHTDHDFSGYDLDAPVEDVQVTGTQGLFDAVRRVADRDSLTLRDVGKLYAQGVLLPQFVGTAEQVADQIEESFNAREADGFMVSAAQTPGTFNDFVDSVVPELQRRGLFRAEYTGNTLRDHLGLDPVRFEAPQRLQSAS